MRMFLVLALLGCSLALGCAKEVPPQATKDVPAPPKGALALGAPIAAGAQTVALGDVAKNPTAFKGKTITTTGTVTSVCQHMGCWMEIKDEASQAHIKMAGHDFFVPKTAAGHKAKVQATLVPSDDENAECNKEAEGQMGHAVAKLQLEATGVELD
jgi:hypothetical protein